MKRFTKISAIMHKLLIEKEMDGFSVTELRDASISISSDHTEPGEARKIVYRQILRFIQNDWLKSEGTGQKKRYFQTELFKTLRVAPKPEVVEIEIPSINDYSILRRERSQYKGELEIVLGEIEEYQSLSHRFPELKVKLAPPLERAKERSAHLIGKVNVLTNVLKTLTERKTTC
ncbi:Transcriptional regulator VspR [Vibrio crassostreae]|uniref:hypothetical protein n=1 Tax=Vibrio TaxID=662 RepID=UPI00037D5805|nr:hypothetical protein [Vibrio splendidus]OEF73973.1 hypothetical protein A148_18010 [Vibrio splendidus 1F-157]PTP59685.1 hypothetical protein CWO23_22550 [Vibrio splendidus]CAK3469122.1 Transcriptional regulator VspR [Vibrio crassostreae]CAK3907280.1 Transcriptional regulator VspR [Vibrio crassostreae]